MIGMLLHDKQSGITGIVDAEVVQADASVLVRIQDRWFIAQALTAAPSKTHR